jgi:NADH:ubiquinone oxidoreductase subunit H
VRVNKVGFVGVLQPFSDAIKLFSREQYFPLVSKTFALYNTTILLLRGTFSYVFKFLSLQPPNFNL